MTGIRMFRTLFATYPRTTPISAARITATIGASDPVFGRKEHGNHTRTERYHTG